MRKSIIITCFFGIFALAACEQKPIAPPPPAWEAQYQKARREADAAFAANQAARAAELFRAAGEVLPAGDARKADCDRLLSTCRFLDAKEKATAFLAQGKREEAIIAIEAARKALPPGDARIAETDRLIQTFRYQIRLKSAQEKMAAKDWLGGAKEFEAARALVPEEQGREARDLQEFCGRFAAAEEVFLVKGEFRKARPNYEELLKNPHGFEKDISERIKAVDDAVQKADAAARADQQAKFQVAVAKGVDLLAKAEWAEAKEVLEGAKAYGLESPEYQARLEVARGATAVPQGFVYVPAGKFRFGAGPASAVTGPEQEVSTEAFYLQKGEVTNEEYRKFLASYHDHSLCHESEPADKNARGHVPENWSDGLDPRASVTGVDWFDAWAYARWAGGRLPTEAEWEKAAGWNPVTGKKSAYPWGDEFLLKRTPSPSGAENMAGGVLEWVSDYYLAYPGGTSKDLDLGNARRVARGGIYLQENEKDDAKVTSRFRFLPDRRDDKIGFRIVKPVSSGERKA